MSRCLTSITIIAALALVLAAPAQAANSKALNLESDVAAHAAIDALYVRLSKAAEALDSSSFSSIYAAKSLYLAPNKPLVTGLSDIKSSWDGWFDWMKEAKGSLTMSFKIVSREVHEDIGYDVGYYKTLQVRPGESTKTFEGKFVVVTKKQADGTWLFHVDAFNSLKKSK